MTGDPAAIRGRRAAARTVPDSLQGAEAAYRGTVDEYLAVQSELWSAAMRVGIHAVRGQVPAAVGFHGEFRPGASGLLFAASGPVLRDAGGIAVTAAFEPAAARSTEYLYSGITEGLLAGVRRHLQLPRERLPEQHGRGFAFLAGGGDYRVVPVRVVR